MMERRNFLKGALIATGSLLLGAATVHRFLYNKETTFEQPLRYFRLISQVFGGNEKGVYLAGGCIGCEKPMHEIGKEHFDNAYKNGIGIINKSLNN